eukprot:4164992-Prymnesium_polylepis.1
MGWGTSGHTMPSCRAPRATRSEPVCHRRGSLLMPARPVPDAGRSSARRTVRQQIRFRCTAGALTCDPRH